MDHPLGFGECYYKKAKSEWKPVVYVSRLMTEIERQYADIEKEVLTITWVYKKFSDNSPGKPSSSRPTTSL